MTGGCGSTATILEIARRLVFERGFSVIPLDHPDAALTDRGSTQAGKRPVTEWKPYQDSAPADQDLTAWFGNGTPRNIGIVTGAISKIVVVDLDSAEGLRWANAHLPPTPMRVVTARGEHLYYRHPGGMTVKNKVRVQTPDGEIDLDIRGDGGYVVAPGSLHHTGHVYRAPERWPDSLDAVPVFDPIWFPTVTQSNTASSAEAGAGESPASVGEGQRNAHLTKMAGAMRHRGAAEGVILAALREENRTRCTPPLDDAEVVGIAASIAKYPVEALSHEQRVEREMARQRANRDATRRLDAEERGPTAAPAFETLRERLGRPQRPTKYRIEDWQPIGSRVILAAQFKAGKTTLIGNLIRSLVDGNPWLDHAAVTPLTGQVLLLDFEMAEGQLNRWLEAQGIQSSDRVIVESMRGRVSAFDILDPTVRSYWAEQLRLRNVTYVIVDCLRPILDGLGLDENSEAGRFLVAFDALLNEAGVSEALIVHHMGHAGERSRGDSRLRDWPDAEWRLVRKDADDPSSARFITAYGRDVDVQEAQLDYHAESRHLTLAGGSRANAKAREALDAILAVIDRATEPLSGRAIKDQVNAGGATRDAVELALKQGVREGVLRRDAGPKNAYLYSRVPVSGSVPPVSGDTASECPSAYRHGHSRTHSEADEASHQPPVKKSGEHVRI